VLMIIIARFDLIKVTINKVIWLGSEVYYS
jgi:hypothetical protein